ncbi:T9SS type A sorting domain-containing protein [Lacinutrix chionoecetis]
MKHLKSFSILLVLAFTLTFLYSFTTAKTTYMYSPHYSSGPASVNGNGYTGAPGESFTCGGCHSGGAYGEPIVNFTVSNMGSPVTEYVPGTTYDMTLSITSSMGSPAAYGMQAVVLDAANNSTGVLANPSSNMQLILGNSGRTYAEHNMRSIPNTFTFEWTAPAPGTGDVRIFSVGNSVNSAQGTGGDNGSTGPTLVTLTENTLSVDEVSLQEQISFYPNPSSGDISINLGNTYANVDLSITNIFGQLVYVNAYSQTEQIKTDLNLASGLYFANVSVNNGNNAIVKFMVK